MKKKKCQRFHNNNNSSSLLLWSELILQAIPLILIWSYVILTTLWTLCNLLKIFLCSTGALILANKLLCPTPVKHSRVLFYFCFGQLKSWVLELTDRQAQNTAWHFAAKCGIESQDLLRGFFLRVIQAYRWAQHRVSGCLHSSNSAIGIPSWLLPWEMQSSLWVLI